MSDEPREEQVEDAEVEGHKRAHPPERGRHRDRDRDRGRGPLRVRPRNEDDDAAEDQMHPQR